MNIPLSWLKEYVDIPVKPKELGDRLTEVGLGCEKIINQNNETLFELEITPNRPDWLSMIGVAREVAAIENKHISFPKLKTDLKAKAKKLTIKIHPNFKASQRMTGIIIDGVTVAESPIWLKDRLESVGQRPINNIVDITNYVMKELGNPIHAFDYHKIQSAEMWVDLAKGGEEFESVDNITYHLPKDAIIYKDREKIFDLAGIKGGKNSGTYKDTKTVFILVPVDDPILIRRASLALSLRSDASAIFERAVNKGGTVDALKRCVDLILELAGGELASELIDLKEEDFKPWKLSLRKERLTNMLGIEIPQKQVVSILESLNLNPHDKDNTIECTIPTYRNDLKIEEDLIEEVARLYGYNNFPKTLPSGEIPNKQVPYFRDYRLDEKIRNVFTSGGFSEMYTYSLIAETDLLQNKIDPDKTLRVDNPISREFEYLRPTLKISLRKALIQNLPNFKKVSLFEFGRVYWGKNIAEAQEANFLSGISNHFSFYEVKGLLNRLFEDLGIKKDPTDSIEVLEEGIFFEINFSELQEKINLKKVFKPLPKYPPIVEDVSFVFSSDIQTGKIIEEVQKQSNLITEVSLLDQYKNSKTFHIVYQHPEKNLTTEEVAKIREKVIKTIQEKFNAEVK